MKVSIAPALSINIPTFLPNTIVYYTNDRIHPDTTTYTTTVNTVSITYCRCA